MKKICLLLVLSIMMMGTFTVTAYADETTTTTDTSGATSTITSGVKEICRTVYALLTSIAGPIATVLVAGAAFMVLFGGERGMEKAKNFMIRVVMVFGLLYASGTIVMELQGMFSTISNPVFTEIGKYWIQG